MGIIQYVKLSQFASGLVSDQTNQIDFPPTAVAAGENMELAGGLRPRNGSRPCSASGLPSGPVRMVKQVRFPTNESSYLVAQVEVEGGDEEFSLGVVEALNEGPCPRANHVVAWDTLRDRLLVYGGYTADPETGAWRYLNDLWSYSPTTNMWTELIAEDAELDKDTPPLRVGSASGAYVPSQGEGDDIGDRLYIYGGRGLDEEGGDISYNRLMAYSFADDAWEDVSSGSSIFPSGEYGCAMASDGEARLFLTGGRDSSGFCASPQYVYTFNLTTGQWSETVVEEIEPVLDGEGNIISGGWNDDWPLEVAESMSVWDGSRFIIIGGGFCTEVEHRYVWKFNPEAGTWERKTDYPDLGEETFGVKDSAAAFFQGRIVSCFGYLPTNGDNPAWLMRYSVSGDSWVDVSYRPPFPAARMAHGMAEDGNAGLWIFGGTLGSRTTGVLGLTNELIYIPPAVWGLGSDPTGTGDAPGSNGLYASPDHLPTETAAFTKIADLGMNSGVCSVAVLNDRAVFTEGVNKPPLVWGGAMAEDASDWIYPKAVLITQDGDNFYDISSKVLDKDVDNAADIGGISSLGYIAVCCDMPQVESFYVEVETPNSGITGEQHDFTRESTFKTDADVQREDHRGNVGLWVQSDGATGTFAGSTKSLVGAATQTEGSATPETTYTSLSYTDEWSEAGASYRVVLTAGELSASGSSVRVTLKSASAVLQLKHVSIGERASGASVVGTFGSATFKELLFDGSSGCTISANSTVTSDWLSFSFDETKDYCLTFDVTNDSSKAKIPYRVSGYRYYMASTEAYNVAAPAGASGGTNTLIISSVEVLAASGVGNAIIPCVGHGFSEGDSISILHTQHYNGTYTLPGQSAGDANHFVLSVPYVEETFSGDDSVTAVIDLGEGSLVAAGQVVVIDGANYGIEAIDAETGLVTLDAPATNGGVSGIYSLMVDGGRLTSPVVTTESGSTVLFDSNTPDTANGSYEQPLFLDCYGFHIRQIVRIPETAAQADTIRVTIYASSETVFHGETYSVAGFRLYGASIMERSGSTDDGTAVPLTLSFATDSTPTYWPNAWVNKGESVFTDWVPFSIAPGDDYLFHLYVYASQSYGSFQRTLNGESYRSDMFVKTVASHGALHGYYQNAYKAALPWTASYGAQSPTNQNFEGELVGLPSSGLAMKIEGKGGALITDGLGVATTTSRTEFPVWFIDGFKGFTTTQETPGDSKIYFSASFDNKKTFKILLYPDDIPTWRTVARLNAGTWEYNSGALGSDTWEAATDNTMFSALREALTQSANQWDKSAVEGSAPADWECEDAISLGNTVKVDFAFGLETVGNDRPSLSAITMSYSDAGTTSVDGYQAGGWASGSGWDDNTIVNGGSLGQTGTIMYLGSEPFTADYSTLSEVPGFWFRIKTSGTSPGTTITRIMYKAPCQPLSNIGDGQPEAPMGFVTVNGGITTDFTAQVSDWLNNEISIAVMDLDTTDYLYIGHGYRFFCAELIPRGSNTNAATLSGEYWNGSQWSTLPILDGTTVDGKTLFTAGKVSWSIPDDWKTNIPFNLFMSRGYWVRFKVSADLSSMTSTAECRIYPVPNSIVKHKFVETFENRLVLGCRPDAPDQIDVSRELEEYGFCGPASLSLRVGGQDSIACAISAWNGLLVGKTESWHQLKTATDGGASIERIEAARFIPINTQVIVKAPADAGSEGNKYGLFFINRYGAFVQTGIHVDSIWNTSRNLVLSGALNWWVDETAVPRLDLNYLHNACGEYWPLKQWIVWSVPMITAEGQTEQTTNNRLIVFDLKLQAWLPPFAITAASMTTGYDYNANIAGKSGRLRMYYGDYNGQVRQLFTPGVFADDDAPVEAWIETGWLSMDSPGTEKELRELWVWGAGASVDIDVISKLYRSGACLSATANHTITDISQTTGPLGAGFETGPAVVAHFFKFKVSCEGDTIIHGIQPGLIIDREEPGQ